MEVLILDINPSLGKQFNAAKDSLILHVQQKLVQMPSKSEIGMVIIGTPESTNILAQTKGGYENICEIREISAVDVALMKTVNSLQLGIDAGDWLDAVVVAMDMIIRHCEKKKYEKNIIMITSCSRSVLDEEQLEVIAQTCLDMKIRFQLYCIDQAAFHQVGNNSSADTSAESSDYRIGVLKKFIDQVNGEIFSINDQRLLKGALSRGSVTSQSVFRGTLYITPKTYDEKSLVGINVWAYTKTKQASLPSLKKRSRDEDSFEGVALVRKYVHDDDNTEEVDFQSLIRAHSYGREDVPVTKDDADNIKMKGEKEMLVLGYMKLEEIGQDELMGNTDIIVPDRDSSMLMISAFTAFASALRKRGAVAIVRWVRRANDSPKLYTVWANSDEVSTCLYAIRHPFLEDLRPCPFSGLLDAKVQTKAVTPEKLNQAAELLILNADAQSMDYRNEFNPVIKSFFELVNQKSTDGALIGSARTNEDNCLMRGWKENAPQEAKDAVAALAALIPSKIVETTIVSGESTKAKMEVVNGFDSVQIKGEYAGSSHAGSTASSQASSLRIIASISESNDSRDINDPISRFVRQWSEDTLDAHDFAIEGMMQAVDHLVKTSPGERFYERALDCLVKVPQQHDLILHIFWY